MVQIPEYTRRENAQPMQRGGMSIGIPDALVAGSAGNVGPKKALQLSKDLAEAFVGMKERRDDGIVSAFMNQYDKDSTAVLISLKEKYQGQDAHKVMSEFQKWRDGYIAEHSSYDEDKAKEGVVYLEDAAQNRIAKQKLDAYNVRDINNISGYIATEEEKFRVNNLNVSIQNNTSKIISENNPENIQILADQTRSYISSLHKGQSSQYIKAQTDPILDAAVYGNVMRDSASDPISSIARFQDPRFSKYMSADTQEKTREQLTKAFVDYQSMQLAKAATGQASNPVGDEFYKQNSGFFKENMTSVRKEISDKAIQNRNSILEDNRRNEIAIQNDLAMQLLDAREMLGNALTEEERANQESRMAATLSALSGVRGGVETAKVIDNVFKEVNDYDWLARNEKNIQSNIPTVYFGEGDVGIFSKARLDEYRRKSIEGETTVKQTAHAINMGEYETLLDIPDFDKYSPHQKKELMRTFASNARYRSLLETAKPKSDVDFNNKIDGIYKFEYGEPYKNPIEYAIFKKEMAQKIVRWLDANPNQVPSSKVLQTFANNSAQPLDKDSAYTEFINAFRGIKFSDRHRDYSVLKKETVKILKDKTSAWWLNKTEEEVIDRAADYMIDGDMTSAYSLLKEAKLYD